MDIRVFKQVPRVAFGRGSFLKLEELIQMYRKKSYIIFILDHVHKTTGLLDQLPNKSEDSLLLVDTTDEPKTSQIDQLRNDILATKSGRRPSLFIGVGGGSAMDIAKAVSNLLTNGGKAEDYQGWDLVKVPGIYKIGVPTLSGTGAEATRTCVMTNKKTGLKLGMNSDFTVYDQLLLDPALTKTVPRDQYFYTGMDAYIHCIESLAGTYRNAIGDAYSEQTITLCRDVFNTDDMMSDGNRSKMMVASYLGGCAIATSYVGVIHPFSAGLSVVLGIHHCVANCITMRAMEEFYPEEYTEFWQMVELHDIYVPEGVCSNLTNEQFDQLYASTVIHEKPLINALGSNFQDILTKEKVIDLFKVM